jgi:pimeloyl-ACP methyl ester carboxylesterase
MSHDGREAQLSESRVRFVDIGQGSPLLLIHGLGGNWQNWLANLPRLAERHRVIAVDLPGFGQSEPFRGPVSMARYVDAIVELLDALEIAEAAFIGNSLGGILTMETAIRHPDRVSAAVLACSGGIPLTTWRQRLVGLPAFRILHRAMRFREIRRRMLAHPVTRHAIASAIVHDATAIESPRLVAALDGLGAPGVRPVLDAGLRYDARSRAPQVRCPTLIVWGRQDRLLPLWMGKRLHALIDGARMVVTTPATVR